MSLSTSIDRNASRIFAYLTAHTQCTAAVRVALLSAECTHYAVRALCVRACAVHLDAGDAVGRLYEVRDVSAALLNELQLGRAPAAAAAATYTHRVAQQHSGVRERVAF